MRSPRSSGAFSLLLVGLVVLAVLLRAHALSSRVLWVDEAESSLNALTILADGVPGDRFLGEPLYENTLVRPWPDHPEYEFRDLSYSDRGLAVYHSWLPLYSIAAAFRLAGVTAADVRRGTPVRNATAAEIAHWTAVPRWPSVVFGALLVVAAWALGRSMHGPPVGLALALAAATAQIFVEAGRQARYYSAALTCSALAGLAIWRAWRRGRVLDHALAGASIGLLFHVHSVSAIAMAVLYVLASPLGWRQPLLLLRLGVAGTVTGLIVLPWAIWSGMLSQTDLLPAARHYVDLGVILDTLPRNPVIWVTVTVGLAWHAVATLAPGRIPPAWRDTILDRAPAIYFALAWQVVSYATYFLLIPAASFFPYRLRLMVAVPGVLLMTLVVSALCRQLRPASRLAPAVMTAALLLVAGQLTSVVSPRSANTEFADFIAAVRSWPVRDAGRLYASPNEHLVLTYYSGRLVQSIAPIRRAWLDRFADDLIVVEGRTFAPAAVPDVKAAAARHGLSLSTPEAVARASDAARLAKVLELQPVVASVAPVPDLDPLDRDLVALTRERTALRVRESVVGTPLSRLTTLATYDDYWQAFFYWFSGAAQRTGERLNYNACRRSAHAYVHHSGYAVLDCRKTSGAPLFPDAAAARHAPPLP